MTSPRDASAVTRERIALLRDEAEARGLQDPLPGLVADANGGDPIPWDDEQRGKDELHEQRP